ncbi:MAG: AAA family ATPase [Muribaculaceae bacterium]|nr:AAA family ATPase [Muribaculaceae bacterium]
MSTEHKNNIEAERLSNTPSVYTRVLVDSCDEYTINCHIEGDATLSYVIDISTFELSYLGDIVRPHDSLNLIEPKIGDGFIRAELIIYEPDFLVNITQVAGCFEAYGTDARISMLKKLSAPANSQAINLGNFASQLLDEEINQQSAPTDYRDSVKVFFRNNAVNLATCEISKDFHTDARKQKDNIAKAIRCDMPSQLPGFDNRNVILEPAFFCEMLGLQGRMDLLQLDYSLLVEQKSGNGEWPYSGYAKPKHRLMHHVQLQLYMAVMHYNYGVDYASSEAAKKAYLLYSRYTSPLLELYYSHTLLSAAIRVRNEIVAYEHRLAAGDIDFLCKMDVESLNKGHSGKLWINYKRKEIVELLSPLMQADELERAYYGRMMRFVAVENLLGKIGAGTTWAPGFASVWRNSVAEKLEAGSIYVGMTMSVPTAGHVGKVDKILLTFAEDGNNNMANFRPGDIVLLYPYQAERVPDARRTIVFRCTIKEIKTNAIELTLRFTQSSALPFSKAEDCLWAIEHDYIDSTYNSLYSGLHSFLSAPDERRDLLLFRRQPEVDESLSLKCDHGVFNELALRVKRARDLFLIIGPPGTGKTSYGLVTTLKEELAEENHSTLILAYTNRAVDEICSKLVADNIEFLRIGPELSCAEEYRTSLLQNKVSGCSTVSEVRELIKRSRVVVSTVSALNANINILKIKTFDLMIVDEASQITEPQMLLALSARGADGSSAIKKIVMIGDHKQLPAVVKQTVEVSTVTERALNNIGLNDCRQSLFERFINRYGCDASVVSMLTHQGRMHIEIADFPSKMFYRGMLKPVFVDRQTAELPKVGDDSSIEGIVRSRRLAFLNIDKDATVADKVNIAEANLIARLVMAIYKKEEQFEPNDTIGVIVPYRNQINAIRRAIASYGDDAPCAITIDTVERFQGSQRKYIIYGFTVKKQSQLDFLTNNTYNDDGILVDRKLNVAMTRAREHLFIVGNAALISGRPVFGAMVDYMHKRRAFFDADNIE